MITNDSALKVFHVRVGHWEMQLKAHSADEAIEVARRHLSVELPRLYDVIRAMTATRFRVEAAA